MRETHLGAKALGWFRSHPSLVLDLLLRYEYRTDIYPEHLGEV